MTTFDIVQREVTTIVPCVQLTMSVEDARILAATLGGCVDSFLVYNTLINALKEIDEGVNP